MVYLHWMILAVYVVVIVATMTAVLMDNRQPVKTMAWLMVLVFLPVVGIVLYFFFGQNIRKERMISQRSMDQLTKRSMLEFAEQQNLHIPENQLPLMRLFANQNFALPFKDNNVEIYTSGYEFFPALLADIARAVHHIHLSTYILKTTPWAISWPMHSSPRLVRGWRFVSSTTMWAVGVCVTAFLSVCVTMGLMSIRSCL